MKEAYDSAIYQIGEFCFRVNYAEGLIIPPNFQLFQVQRGDPEYEYTISVTEHLPQPAGSEAARREDIKIFFENGMEHRLIGVKGQEEYYACYQEISDHSAWVSLSADSIRDLNFDPVFVSLFALERRMIHRDSMILHCAYMKDRGEAILFSAPSETGKTTQANLWEKYRGSKTVNGDRALLRKINGRWHACGWPVCGTSEVCHDQTVPIHTIVMLKQGKSNQIRKLHPMQAFTLICSQITANRWNAEDTAKTLDLIEDLIGQVPVYELSCTISKEAVECLEAVLYPGEVGKGIEI